MAVDIPNAPHAFTLHIPDRLGPRAPWRRRVRAIIIVVIVLVAAWEPARTAATTGALTLLPQRSKTPRRSH